MTAERDAIAELHASLADRRSLIEARKSLYAMALRILSGDRIAAAVSRTPALLDSPLLRSAVDRALAGTPPPGTADLERARRLDEGSIQIDGAYGARLVVGPTTADLLLEPARRLGRPAAPLRFVSDVEPDMMREAAASLVAGLMILRRYSPRLLDDLMPHVCVIAAVHPEACADIRSASLREFGGLLVLSTAENPVGVAEQLLHEAAHQKMFDLMQICEIKSLAFADCEPFSPSWHLTDPRWPLEQAVAAFHTYCCLAQLWTAITTDVAYHSDPSLRPPSVSLLPHAHERVAELGEWLLQHEEFLGRDAQHLIRGLLGHPDVGDSCPEPPSLGPATEGLLIAGPDIRVVDDLEIDVEASADHALAGRSGPPFDFFVLDRDSGLVLDMLRRQSLREVVGNFAHLHDAREKDSENHVLHITRELRDKHLISVEI